MSLTRGSTVPRSPSRPVTSMGPTCVSSADTFTASSVTLNISVGTGGEPAASTPTCRPKLPSRPSACVCTSPVLVTAEKLSARWPAADVPDAVDECTIGAPSRSTYMASGVSGYFLARPGAIEAHAVVLSRPGSLVGSTRSCSASLVAATQPKQLMNVSASTSCTIDDGDTGSTTGSGAGASGHAAPVMLLVMPMRSPMAM
mmetsp:Transcript_21122/g.74506  ORF Transcript_21122/g.74506 Transcript_21122/m.74506 type:complete len:201 (+) Transcript_21122:1419-2021(+)